MWSFKNIRNEINGVTFLNVLTITTTNELYRDFRPKICVRSFIKIDPSTCSLRHEQNQKGYHSLSRLSALDSAVLYTY